MNPRWRPSAGGSRNWRALPDFLLASSSESRCRAGIGTGVRRSGAPVAGARPAPAPGDSQCAPGDLSALPGAGADADLLAVLQALVENGDPPLCRYQAVRVLGFWAARDDVCAFLVSCLSSPERLVRLGAAESLRMAAAGPRPGLEPVLAARALEESDEEVLQALGPLTGTPCQTSLSNNSKA